MTKPFEIETLSQVKAISSPIRKKLMDLFCREALTTKQAAIILDENPTKLYHHVDCLKKAGFLKLVKTKRKRGTVEKYFQAVATDFKINPALFNPETTGNEATKEIYNLVRSNFEDALQEIKKSLTQKLKDKSGHYNPLVMKNSRIFFTKEKAEELVKVMEAWIDKNCDSDLEENSPHQLTMTIYPIVE